MCRWPTVKLSAADPHVVRAMRLLFSLFNPSAFSSDAKWQRGETECQSFILLWHLRYRTVQCCRKVELMPLKKERVGVRLASEVRYVFSIKMHNTRALALAYWCECHLQTGKMVVDVNSVRLFICSFKVWLSKLFQTFYLGKQAIGHRDIVGR